MRFRMRRGYNDDIVFFKYRSTLLLYCLLVLIFSVLPLVSDAYMIYMLNLLLINTIIAIGLQLLTGYTGLLSLGHSAFFGIGAYGSAFLTSTLGLSFWTALPLSGAITAMVGFAVGVPSLRMKGLYLAIATMAFAFITEQVILQWQAVTNGVRGVSVDRPTMVYGSVFNDYSYYYLSLVITLGLALFARNLLRAPSGRALIAIRDSELAAQAVGISMARYKVMIFGVSAFYAGIAGSLFAHFMQYIAPENFTLMESIGFIVMIVIGGLGSLQGAVVGAGFITFLPEGIRFAKDLFPFVKQQSGLQMVVYALILILFILYEPHGLYGRWVKIKFYFEMFPFYKKETFRRERKYYKTQKWR